MAMQIYIPTLGRSEPIEQPAYAQLSAAGLNPLLVVDKTDKADYSGFNCLRANVKPGIAAKRQWILAHALANSVKFCQFDDDMTISAVDMVDDKCVISKASNARVRQEMNRAEKLLDKYAHGGVHTRHFVNHAKKPFILNRGYIRQIGFYNPALMPKVPKYTGRTAEDVRFMVDCLEQGLDYFMLTSCCMIEIKSANLPSHFTQLDKNVDMIEFTSQYPQFVRDTADGRVTMAYALLLRAAKQRIANSGAKVSVKPSK